MPTPTLAAGMSFNKLRAIELSTIDAVAHYLSRCDVPTKDISIPVTASQETQQPDPAHFGSADDAGARPQISMNSVPEEKHASS